MNELPFADLPDGVVDAAIDRAALARHAEREAEDSASDGSDHRVAEAFERLLRIVAGGRRISPKTAQLIGQRFLILMWLLRPDAVPGCEGRAVSMRDIAKLLRLSHPALVKDLAQIQGAVDLENAFTRSHGGKRRRGAKAQGNPVST